VKSSITDLSLTAIISRSPEQGITRLPLLNSSVRGEARITDARFPHELCTSPVGCDRNIYAVRARAGLLMSETDWALCCLSNQTQAQQIGIQQPLDRRPLRLEMLEGRHE
jgi:hypothetical protein